ncbi:MAG: hypothetical protein IT370_37520 [Deltaproteobacteria bacterium]|nr:hypothetical protein [Deltaproteobacteria bacterium]
MEADGGFAQDWAPCGDEPAGSQLCPDRALSCNEIGTGLSCVRCESAGWRTVDMHCERRPDAGTADAGTSCDPLAQDCGSGSKCVVGYIAPSCFPVTSSKDEGAPCDAIAPVDECAAGLVCVAEDGSATSRAAHCRRYCRGDADCSGNPRVRCAAWIGGIGVCRPVCRPFAQDCAPSSTCGQPREPFYLATTLVPDILVCRPAGPAQRGGSCTPYLSDCGADLFCGSAYAPGICVPECDAAHPCDHGSCWLKWGTAGYCK